MNKKKISKHIFPLLKGSIATLITNPLVIFPFATIAFVQLLVLEILYFSPRFPLINFFGPLIQRFFKGEDLYLHYPFNFLVIPKLFQITQAPTYIFISSFFVALAVAIIANVNNNQRINLKSLTRATSSKYIHIFVGALVTFLVFFFLYKMYGVVIDRAEMVRSTKGPFFILKMLVIQGAPFVHLVIAAVVTSIFAFLFPIIVLEKKNVFHAIILNFKSLWGSYWFMIWVVLIPTLFYLPVSLLTIIIPNIFSDTFPALRFIVLILSVLVSMVIDAIIYTSLTTYYLAKKENS